MKKILYLLIITIAIACNREDKRAEEPVTVKIDLNASQSRENIADFQNRIAIKKLM